MEIYSVCVVDHGYWQRRGGQFIFVDKSILSTATKTENPISVGHIEIVYHNPMDSDKHGFATFESSSEIKAFLKQVIFIFIKSIEFPIKLGNLATISLFLN